MLATVLLAAALGAPLPGDGLIDYDTRWKYPQYLNARPADGQVVDVNPPRMSWPYVPETIPDGHPELRLFTLQIADSDAFNDPAVQIVDTPYNFFNALPVLDVGEWHWRVGYRLAEGEEEIAWSQARSFVIPPEAVEWDRTVITRAHELLAECPHPRIGPADGDWDAFHAELAAHPQGASYLARVLNGAETATREDWWQDFPQSDDLDTTGLAGRDWIRITNALAVASMAWRLTGNESLRPAKEHILTLASFPIGGQTSPEYHAPVRKWPTQIPQHLAVCYDLWYQDLSAEERAAVREAIEWRLDAIYNVRASWRQPDGTVHRGGVAVLANSHPYENFVWATPAVLLLAGDSPLADELTPLVLHYLTGVTASHGPDEGWNEGLSYAAWKSLSMLQAAVATELLLPELELGRSPYFPRLSEWFAHLHPLGIRRLPFGDYGQDPEGKRGPQLHVSKFIAWLSADGRATHRFEALAEELGDRPSGYSWWDLVASVRLTMADPEPYDTSEAFREAGWVMVSTRPPNLRDDFAEAVGMIFKCRPRGGYSHSFRSEGDFVWHAHGQTLSVGAGGAYPDPHSRHSISHNVVLINGEGQEWNHRNPAYPYAGRLLAYEEGDGYTWWVGDATHTYQTVPGLQRWLRHVIFVDDRWFVIFDDLAMDEDADPARFSWLLKVDRPVELAMEGGNLRWTMEDVHARVALAEPDAVDIVNLQSRDGYRNLITGDDLWEHTVERLENVGREINEEMMLAHNIWVTNREPAREHTFLAALTAWPDGEGEPEIAFSGAGTVSVTWPDGHARTVSFDPAVTADITVDIDAVRAHQVATEPQ